MMDVLPVVSEHSKFRDRRGYYQKFVRRCREGKRDRASVQSAGRRDAVAAGVADAAAA